MGKRKVQESTYQKPIEHEIKWFPALCAYIQYAVVISFGHLRDFMGNFFGYSRYLSKRPRKGYAPMLVSWENFYTKRFYHRIQDVFNRPVTGAPGAYIDICSRVTTDGNKTLHMVDPIETTRCLNLGSYNYLGFADDWMASCSKSVLPHVEEYPVASNSSSIEYGTTPLHRELESLVAEFVGKEEAMVFNMGYGTNSTTIPALFCSPGSAGKSLIISDSLNHASIVNGSRGANVVVKVFNHNDPGHLESVLRKAIAYGQPRTRRPWAKILVMIEGIYSMEGEIVNLRDIVTVAKKYKAYLYVDEAHSIGALGKTGRGICEYCNVDPADIDILMGTFTKSFAGMGGYVAASKEVIRHLRVASAGGVSDSSLSPIIVSQVLASLKIIMYADLGKQKLKALRENSNHFRKRMVELGCAVLGNDDSPVVPIMLYTPSKIAAFSRECLKRNIAVVTVGFPATPLLLARVRFCLSASHTIAGLDKSIDDLKEVIKLCGMRHESHMFG